jgi:hypothetical protein
MGLFGAAVAVVSADRVLYKRALGSGICKAAEG